MSDATVDGRAFREAIAHFATGVTVVTTTHEGRPAGMKVGGRRRITIPPHLAYGKRGAGGVIGPDETLVFVVDLIGVG